MKKFKKNKIAWTMLNTKEIKSMRNIMAMHSFSDISNISKIAFPPLCVSHFLFFSKLRDTLIVSTAVACFNFLCGNGVNSCHGLVKMLYKDTKIPAKSF